MTSSFSKRVKNPSVALQATEQPLHFVAPLVHFLVVLPRIDPIGLGWNHRHEAKIERQLAGFIAFVSAIHQQMNRPLHWPQVFKQRAACGCVMCVARRQSERDGCSSICGNHMNFWCSIRRAISRWIVGRFFNAPVPSGCTLMLVESSETASIFDAHDLAGLQLGEHPVQHTGLGPTVNARVHRMPVAKALGQTAPFAAMLCDVKKGVDYLQVGHADIAALQR